MLSTVSTEVYDKLWRRMTREKSGRVEGEGGTPTRPRARTQRQGESKEPLPLCQERVVTWRSQMKVKPLSPAELKVAKESALPDAVFEVVNLLLTKSTIVRQCDVMEMLTKKFGVTREQVFEEKWLDFEGAYRRRGWDVAYDKPGFNESSYEPFWKFTPKD